MNDFALLDKEYQCKDYFANIIKQLRIATFILRPTTPKLQKASKIIFGKKQEAWSPYYIAVVNSDVLLIKGYEKFYLMWYNRVNKKF